MAASEAEVAKLLTEIRGCRVCAAHLKAGPRPIVQLAAGARIVIIGQAPGSKVHASGEPWNDASGDRLRDWTGLDREIFYDPRRVALVPLGFCYPGAGNGGDLPPRPECAPLWHARALGVLPPDRLTLLVGGYAQSAYLPAAKGLTMTETVRRFADFDPAFLPLPHPAWRSAIWMKANPWYEAEVVSALRAAVRAALSAAGRS